jgi:hypothetical protein
VVVHEQLTDEDVVRLADQDNESDEYHVKVPLLDTWASYAALADAGWTQERIAKAKGTQQARVAQRLKLHRELPKSARKGVFDGLLEEAHCEAVLSVVFDVEYSSWLTTAQARDELVRDVTVSASDTRHRYELFGLARFFRRLHDRVAHACFTLVAGPVFFPSSRRRRGPLGPWYGRIRLLAGHPKNVAEIDAPNSLTKS